MMRFFLTTGVLLALFLFALPFRLYHITDPLLDYQSFRQAQTATIAKNFYLHGISLVRTELDSFGIGKEQYLTLEFPVYEAIVTLFYKLFFVSDLWGRVVSVISGYIGAVFLYHIVFLVTKKRQLALLSTAFYLVIPVNMYFHRTFLMDPTIITFLLGGMLYGLYWIEKRRGIHWLLSLIFFSFGFVQKGLYGPFWLIPLTVAFLQRNKETHEKSRIVRFIFLSGIPLLVLGIWQHYINNLNVANGHSFFTTSNSEHLEWNFGFFADRFLWELWEPRLWFIMRHVFPGPGLIILLIGLINAKEVRKQAFFFAWFLSGILYYLIVFRIQVNNYYLLPVIPVAAIFLAIGLSGVRKLFVQVIRFLGGGSVLRIWIPRSISVVIFAYFTFASFRNLLWSFQTDWSLYYALDTFSALPKPNAYGIVVVPKNDWNPVYPYYSKRKVLFVPAAKFTKYYIDERIHEGYSFVLLDEHLFVTTYGEAQLSLLQGLLKQYDPTASLFNGVRFYHLNGY